MLYYTDGQKAFVPVDSITSGNMKSVTSNAVLSFTLNSLIDLLSHTSTLVVNAPSGTGQKQYVLGYVSVSKDTKIRFLYWQENTLTSNARNTLFLREHNTTTTRYQRAAMNNRLGRGFYIWEIQLYANITYDLGLWCADLSDACTYSNFSAIPLEY